MKSARTGGFVQAMEARMRAEGVGVELRLNSGRKGKRRM